MGGQSNKNLVLAAMVFAVAMTFIDQTIVAIAIPDVQRSLGLPRGRSGESPEPSTPPDVLEPQPTEMEA